MNLQALLLSRDPQSIRILRHTLELLAIDVEVCRGASSGNEILASEKFDAVIVDCDDLHGGLDVLANLRKTASNRHTVAFAVLNGTGTHRAFELGASFVLQKPLSTISANRCFSAALGLMERERRRYFRHPLQIGVAMAFGPDHKFEATTTNLSEGGMAIRFRGRLPKAGLSKVSFTIPDLQTAMECKAELAWVDAGGWAGVRFVEMSRKSRQELERWLEKQITSADSEAEERAAKAGSAQH